MDTALTEPQLVALKTLAINGQSTKARPQMRALVRRGLASQKRYFEGPSLFTITPEGERALAALKAEEAA